MNKAEEIAKELGFDLAGTTQACPPSDLAHFDRWLEKGMEGEMEYLRRQRERIADPKRTLPAAQSILCVGLNHARPPQTLPGGGKIARYALGRDYHNRIGKMLEKLRKALVQAGLVRNARGIVDAGPLIERSHAADAGLGFRSKSGNLLSRRFGPWFFLGELLLDTELEPSPAAKMPDCGSCTACIEACPTKAIVEPFVVDARRCISYLTIEHRSPIAPELRPSIGDWVFGCDICSEVCPFGWKAPDSATAWGTHEAVSSFRLIDLLSLSEAEFRKRFEGSPIKRAKRKGLIRNALIAIANLGQRDAIAAVRQSKDDPDPEIREQASWSLEKLQGRSPS